MKIWKGILKPSTVWMNWVRTNPAGFVLETASKSCGEMNLVTLSVFMIAILVRSVLSIEVNDPAISIWFSDKGSKVLTVLVTCRTNPVSVVPSLFSL